MNLAFSNRFKKQLQEELPTKEAISFGEGVGIELEYMIVSKEDFRILPIADKILSYFDNENSGKHCAKMPEEIGISNEIVSHVIEFKSNTPVRDLIKLTNQMMEAIGQVNLMLESHNAILLPGSMHPFMDPTTETVIWSGEYKEIYNKFDELFDIKKHCWSNIQGVHLNIPYSSHEEYENLTAAIRILLPLIPALTASSTICENEITKQADYRLWNQIDSRKRFPSLMGTVIPEPIFTVEEYKSNIWRKIDLEIEVYDPEMVMHPEWLNHRAAIPRFSRNCIEIKIIDIQENPIMDIALCRFMELIIKGLMNNWWNTSKNIKAVTSEELLKLYMSAVHNAENAVFDNQNYLEIFGANGCSTAKSLLQKIFGDLSVKEKIEDIFIEPICSILEMGTLSTRLRKVFGNGILEVDKTSDICRKLSNSLQKGIMFYE